MSAELAALANVRLRLAAELSVPVYDLRAPQGQAMPYVVLSNSTEQAADTDNTRGFDLELDIHAWDDSTPYTRTTVANIQWDIYEALHRFDTLDIGEVYRVIGIDQTLKTIALDPDGITRHGVQSFRIQFEPLDDSSLNPFQRINIHTNKLVTQ